MVKLSINIERRMGQIEIELDTIHYGGADRNRAHGVRLSRKAPLLHGDESLLNRTRLVCEMLQTLKPRPTSLKRHSGTAENICCVCIVQPKLCPQLSGTLADEFWSAETAIGLY